MREVFLKFPPPQIGVINVVVSDAFLFSALVCFVVLIRMSLMKLGREFRSLKGGKFTRHLRIKNFGRSVGDFLPLNPRHSKLLSTLSRLASVGLTFNNLSHSRGLNSCFGQQSLSLVRLSVYFLRRKH